MPTTSSGVLWEEGFMKERAWREEGLGPTAARQATGDEGARAVRTIPASIAPAAGGAKNADMKSGLLEIGGGFKERGAPRAISTRTATGRVCGGALNF